MTLLPEIALVVDCKNRTAPEDPNGEYFAVGTPAMRGNIIDFNSAKRISRETYERWTERLEPRKGDVLLAREAPVGPVVRVPGSPRIAAGQRTVHLRAIEERCDARYLFYMLSSPRIQARLLALGDGSTTPHIRLAELRVFDVGELPSLGDQYAIGRVLGAPTTRSSPIAGSSLFTSSCCAQPSRRRSTSPRQPTVSQCPS